MNLIKTSILTSISTLVRILSGFVINKVIAMYAGPSGLAIVGQLQNFNSLVMTFAKGGISQGIVKYTAEYKTIEEKQNIFSTSMVVSIVASLIIAIVLLVFNEYFSTIILKDTHYSSVFTLFGFTIVLFALNSVFMSILNGQKEIKKYVLVNIVSSIFSLFFTSWMVIQFELIGALYALVLNQSIIFFITLIFLLKTSWFKISYFIKGIDKESLHKLSHFSLMAIVTAIVVPISHLLIRNYIGENLSWEDAGYWQGMWYISTMYLLFVTTALSVYYTPKLSELTTNSELKQEIISGYIKIIPFVIVLALTIYFFKELAVKIAFSDEFLPMIELFKWQLIGDVIKIAAFLLSTMMIAKAMTKKYIYSEIFFSSSFVLLSIYLIQQYGLIGITYAYAINYLFYFIFLLFTFRGLLNDK